MTTNPVVRRDYFGLGSRLAMAADEEEVFRIAAATFAPSGVELRWWPHREAPAQLVARLEGPTRFLPEERLLLLRVEVRGAPRAVVALGGVGLSEQELVCAELLAGQLSLACEAAQTIWALSRLNAELAMRNRLAEAAANIPELPRFLRAAVAELRRHLRCDGLSLYLMDEASEQLVLTDHVGGSDEAEAAFGRVEMGKGLVGKVAKDGKVRCWHPEDFGPVARPVIERMGFGTGLAVPLRTRARLLGVINPAWFARREVSWDERQTVEALGSHFAAVIEAQLLTDQVRLHAGELAEAQARLVQHERSAAVGEMVALVAHEVRTPLAVLYNAIACLRRGPTTEDATSLMEMVVQEGDRLNRMIEDLVRLTEPPRPQPSPTDLPALLQRALEAVGPHLPPGAQPLALECPEDLPALPLDARVLGYSVECLLRNAAQAVGPAGRIRVSAARVDGPFGAAAQIDIADDGPGVEDEVAARIFEPFFTTRASGAGLGLPLARQLLRGQGGDVTLVDGRSGRTTFRLTLPLTQVPPEGRR